MALDYSEKMGRFTQQFHLGKCKPLILIHHLFAARMCEDGPGVRGADYRPKGPWFESLQ